MNLANLLATDGRRANEGGVCGFYLGPAYLMPTRPFIDVQSYSVSIQRAGKAEGEHSYANNLKQLLLTKGSPYK